MNIKGQTRLHMLMERGLPVPPTVFSQIGREDGQEAQVSALRWVSATLKSLHRNITNGK